MYTRVNCRDVVNYRFTGFYYRKSPTQAKMTY